MSDDAQYIPCEEDVVLVQKILLAKIPFELIQPILDAGRYWASVLHTETTPISAAVAVRQDSDGVITSKWCYIATPPVPRHVKCVQITTSSHDQGWGGALHHRGTYNGSYSWIEAVLLKAEDVPSWIENTPVDLYAIGAEKDDALGTVKWRVTANVVAQSEYKTHDKIWTSRDSEAESGESEEGRDGVSTIQAGDRIALIIRALYPGWQNHVRNASIRVFYAV